jgi:predicted acylesterase/phospholipase RssA/CRP-like cAMP-binding protein
VKHVPPPLNAEALFENELFAAADPAAVQSVKSSVVWTEVSAGEALFVQGDLPGSLFVIWSGLLRVMHNGIRMSEVGTGAVIGELGLLLGSARTADVIAVRNSIVAELPAELAKALLSSSPGAAMRLARLAATRRDQQQNSGPPRVVGLTGDDPELLRRLAKTLQEVVPIARIHSAADDDNLIATADALPGSLVVLMLLDPADSQTTTRLQQCDLVFVIVGSTDGQPLMPSPTLQRAVRTLDRANLSPVLDLVVCHKSMAVMPSGTRRVVDGIDVEFAQVHHVSSGEAGNRSLGRRITGTQIGLVLSGGGARAMSHIGVVQAICERGEEFDLVGGTSIGALVACALAQLPHGSTSRDVERLGNRMASAMAELDLGKRITVPVVSILSVRRAYNMYTQLLGNGDLLDSWRPCFVTTGDLTACQLVIIRKGQVDLWALASASPPGLWPPVVDEAGHLHVDGALYDNLPVIPMRLFGANRVIAINVSNRSPFRVQAGGSQVPSFWRFAQQRFGKGRSAAFPTIAHTLARTIVAPSLAAQDEAKAAADLVIEPAVESIGLADYKDSAKAIRAGLAAGRAVETDKPVETDIVRR